MTYQEKIVNIETNEETVRKYTKEEIAVVEANLKLAEEEAKKEAAKLAAKASLLEKLGITEEEAKLLLS